MTERNGWKNVSFAEAKEILDTVPGSVLIDVREEEEFITGHAADAALLPLSVLCAETAAEAQPDKTKPVLLYCRTGARSESAAFRFAELGYTRVYNVGSLVGWPYGTE